MVGSTYVPQDKNELHVGYVRVGCMHMGVCRGVLWGACSVYARDVGVCEVCIHMVCVSMCGVLARGVRVHGSVWAHAYALVQQAGRRGEGGNQEAAAAVFFPVTLDCSSRKDFMYFWESFSES